MLDAITSTGYIFVVAMYNIQIENCVFLLQNNGRHAFTNALLLNKPTQCRRSFVSTWQLAKLS